MTQALVDRHDVELAAQAAAGGRREFGELVRRHGSAVRGLLRRMGAQASLADDPTSLPRVELGLRLWFEPRLSANNQLSCATCHHHRKGLRETRAGRLA